MNYFKINTGQVAFFAGEKVSEKEKSVSRIGLNTVLGESPFGDQEMEIQLMGGGKLRGKGVRFYGALSASLVVGYRGGCLKA